MQLMFIFEPAPTFLSDSMSYSQLQIRNTSF